MKDKLKRWSLLFLGLGTLYLLVEILWTSITAIFTKGSFALIGHSSLWMIMVGGIMGLVLGSFNQFSWVKLNMFWQSIIGMVMIFIIEFFSGYLLNIVLKFNIWDYSNLWFNIEGQITFLFTPLWFLICPLAFWADDWFRSIFFGDDEPAYIWVYYKATFDINN
jgi:hypothetical protein